jgi:hypothetical protein
MHAAVLSAPEALDFKPGEEGAVGRKIAPQALLLQGLGVSNFLSRRKESSSSFPLRRESFSLFLMGR